MWRTRRRAGAAGGAVSVPKPFRLLAVDLGCRPNGERNHPGITSVNHVRTIHTAPDAIFVAVSADFDDRISMGDGEELIEQLEAQLKEISPCFSSIYIRPEKRQDAVVIAPE